MPAPPHLFLPSLYTVLLSPTPLPAAIRRPPHPHSLPPPFLPSPFPTRLLLLGGYLIVLCASMMPLTPSPIHGCLTVSLILPAIYAQTSPSISGTISPPLSSLSSLLRPLYSPLLLAGTPFLLTLLHDVCCARAAWRRGDAFCCFGIVLRHGMRAQMARICYLYTIVFEHLRHSTSTSTSACLSSSCYSTISLLGHYVTCSLCHLYTWT